MATSLHHSSRGQKKARAGEEESELNQGPEDSSSPAGALQLVRRRARRRAVCQPGRAGGAAGADPAAHRGAACGNCFYGADPRRSCAAVCGPAGGSAQALRHQVPEQVIDMPKITSTDVIPQRAVLRVPQMSEQLADEPVPSFDDFELVQEEEEEEDEHPQVVPGLVFVMLMAVLGLWVRRGCTGG